MLGFPLCNLPSIIIFIKRTNPSRCYSARYSNRYSARYSNCYIANLNSYSFWVLINLCYNNVLHIINYVSCILYYIICTILYQIIYMHTSHKFIFVLSSHDIYLSHIYYFMSYETIYII